MEDAKELLADGIAALRANEFWHAETFFLEAYQTLSRQTGELTAHEFAYLKAACYGLGRVYRLTGRHELAVTILERALPNPVAFKDLIKAFRYLAEAAQAQGDHDARGGWYHRMYSLARIHSVVTNLRLPNRPEAMDWQRGARWIDELRQKHGTIYAYRFGGGQIVGDTLLTRQDYQALEECRQLAAAAAVPAPPENGDAESLLDSAGVEEPPPLEMTALRDFPLDKLEAWPETPEFDEQTAADEQ